MINVLLIFLTFLLTLINFNFLRELYFYDISKDESSYYVKFWLVMFIAYGAWRTPGFWYELVVFIIITTSFLIYVYNRKV